MFKWVMKEVVIPAVMLVSAVFFLIFSVALPFAPMFGVAMMADAYGDAWAFLFIPYFLFLPLLCMPLAFLFDCAAGYHDD